MTVNRKWCCSLFHAVQHQFGQRMFPRHCTPCASHGWGAELGSGHFSAPASLYKFKQIMPTLSEPSHDTEMSCGLELTSWDVAVPLFFTAFSLCCHGLFSHNCKGITSQPTTLFSLHPTTEFQYISILGSGTRHCLKLQRSATIFSQIKLIYEDLSCSATFKYTPPTGFVVFAGISRESSRL